MATELITFSITDSNSKSKSGSSVYESAATSPSLMMEITDYNQECDYGIRYSNWLGKSNKDNNTSHIKWKFVDIPDILHICKSRSICPASKDESRIAFDLTGIYSGLWLKIQNRDGLLSIVQMRENRSSNGVATKDLYLNGSLIKIGHEYSLSTGDVVRIDRYKRQPLNITVE